MDTKFSPDQNTAYHDGKKLVFREYSDDDVFASCSRCYFRFIAFSDAKICACAPCTRREREDNANGYFVVEE